jgi:hypothetical protein
MRLTVFHNPTVKNLWTNSLNKLITPLNYSQIETKGNVHIAVFNDGIVGISVSNKNFITYLNVRDITRRRGVGKYLLEETIKFIFNDYQTVYIDTSIFPSEEQDGLIYFLEMEGFTLENKATGVYKYSAK